MEHKTDNILPASPRRLAFTIIELLVTLALIGALVGATLMIVRRTQEETAVINQRLARVSALESCLDLLIEDLRAAAAQNLRVLVQSESIGQDQTSSRIVIQYLPATGGDEPDKTIEWLSAPRYGREDLTLFRRVQSDNRDENTDYIPLLEGLHNFHVEKVDRLLLQITAQLYRTDPPEPDQVIIAMRSFCVERFRTQ